MSVKYRGKYILDGLNTITPEMESDLDKAYEICMSYKNDFPCEMCGRCCHQPHIIVQPHEIDRVSSAAGIPLYDFMTQYIVQTEDGRMLFRKTDPCAFLGKDNKCKIWKDRPEICNDFPYAVSMFMSRVYLALTNDDVDVMNLISYMDDTWPCTSVIKRDVSKKIDEARKFVKNR